MRTYRIDRKEESVAEVQRYLRALSYRYESIPHVGTDGIYGEETREAVRAFQALFSLDTTGDTDKDTFDLLYKEYFAYIAANA